MKLKFLFCVLLVSCLGNLFAHDNKSIHPDYLSAPAKNIVVPSGDFNHPYHEISQYFSPCSGAYCIRQGSIDEDSSWGTEAGAFPYIKHFYNPMSGEGLFFGGFVRESALDYGRKIFSDAVSQYRKGKIDSAYYKLGRALHVLQDMSSPAHVATAGHGMEGVYYDLNGILFDWELITGFETWILSKSVSMPKGTALVEYLSWDDFARGLANATYSATVITGTLNESEEQPSNGELAEMFPPKSEVGQGVGYMEYVSQLGLVKYWEIDDVGIYDPYGWVPFINDTWFAIGKSAFYISNPYNAVPAKYKGMPNLGKQSLAEIWVDPNKGNLINLPIDYSAGLMKYFYDLVNMPPHLKKVVLSQKDSPVYMAEWADGGSSRTRSISVNKPIVIGEQLNIELEFSRPMSAASVSFPYTTKQVDPKGKFFDETRTKWTAYIEADHVGDINEGVQELVVTGQENTATARGLDANPETIAMRDASGNLLNYEGETSVGTTAVGGSDKTHKLTFQGTPPVVSINYSVGAVCAGISGISKNTFAGYTGNEYNFIVNDSTTGIKYFKLSKISGGTLIEETLETPLASKTWSRPSLDVGSYVLLTEDELGNRTSIPFRVETLDIDLDKTVLNGVPTATTEGYSRLASARFGVKIKSSAGLRSVDLSGLEYTGNEIPPVERLLQHTDLNGDTAYELTNDISGGAAPMGGIYKVVAKDLAGNGRTLVIVVSPVSGDVENSCQDSVSCQNGTHDLWKVMLGISAESQVPSNSGIMPGAAILRAKPVMDWEYTREETPLQVASRHDMGYVDIGVQSDGGGGNIPRVDYYEVPGENACPSDAFYAYNGCSEGVFGCVTPMYSRCAVGTKNVSVSVGRYATFTHSAVNAGQTALPLGMCPEPCYNTVDQTCSCTQSLAVHGSILYASVYGISYSTSVESGVTVLAGTNVAAVAAPGLEIVFDQVTETGGGVIGCGVSDPAPAGYQRIAEYEISNSVPFSGMATMKFDYDSSLVNSAQTALAKIYKVISTGGTLAYQEIETTVDTAAHKIIGRVGGFSKYMAVCPVQAAPSLVSNGTTPSGTPAFSLLSDGVPSVQAVSSTSGSLANAVRGLLVGGLVPVDQIYAVSDSTSVYSPYGLLSIAYDENELDSKGITEDAISLYGFDESGNAERLDGINIDATSNFISGRVYSTKSYYAVLASTIPVPLPPVDSEAPATAVTHVTAAYKPNPYIVYASSSVSIALDAYDMPVDTSVAVGVQATYYKMEPDSATIVAGLNSDTTQYYSLYTSTLSLVLGEGRHLMIYGSVDKKGLFESLEMESIYVDISSPVSEFEILGSSVVIADKLFTTVDSSISIVATDPLFNNVASGIKKVFYMVDRDLAECVSAPTFIGSPGTCDNPLYSGPFGLSQGSHVIRFLSEDNVGNIETLKTASVSVLQAMDVTPPVTSLAFYGARESGAYINAGTTVTIDAVDPVDGNGYASGVASIYYLLDADVTVSTALPYSGGFTLSEGTHTISYTSVDGFNNFDVLHSSSVVVDATAPKVELGVVGSSSMVSGVFQIDSGAYIVLVASDPVSNGVSSGISMPLTLIDVPPDSCQSDPEFIGPVGTCSNPRYTEPFNLAQGSHTVYYTAMDNAGNMADIQSVSFIVSPSTAAAFVIEPSSGPIGLPFTIAGSGFGAYAAGTTVVLLGDTTASLTLWTDTKIQGAIPGALAAGQYPVVVKRGSEVLSEVSPFTVVQPEFYALAPSSGPIGMPFAITGAGFGNYSSAYTHVLIGDTTAPLTLWTDSKIQGTIPGGLASGQYSMSVERRTADGGLVQTASMTFEVVGVDVASMSPVSGPIGLPFTIYGGSFGNYVANYTRVLIGGTTAPLTLWTQDKIQGVIPGALGPGEYPVVVERQLNGGIVQSQALSFAVSTPTVYNMTPSSGPIGLPFTINGASFGNYSSAYTGVLINGATVPLTLWTDTQIKGTIPGSLVPGQYPVVVGRMTTDGGMVGSNELTFTLVGVNVASMTPVAGPIGMPFTIYGGNFGNYSAGYTKVLIGGTTCPLTLWTDAKIQGTVPGSLSAGDYQMIVERNLNGGQVQSAPVAFTVAMPEVYSLNPSSGPIGLPFTITGANFGNYVANYTKVLIGGATAPLTLWADAKIQGTIPGSLASGNHEVVVERALNGEVVRTSTFNFTSGEPYLDTVSPSTASVIAPFTLTGYNFGNYVANYTRVLINGTTTALTLWADTRIQGKLPFLTSGTYPVQVQRYLNGGLAESSTVYINIEEPVISSMTPTSGAVGAVFNLYGTGFGPYDATIAKAFIGGAQCSLSLWTDTRITGTVPSGLSYGTHTVVAARGQALSNTLEFNLPGGYSPSMIRLGTGLSSLEFKLGEVYVYPDPAKGGRVPAFHIEVGTADSVKLRVFSVAGQLAHEVTLTGSPQAVGSVYAYEYAWNGRIASGVYYYTMEAERSGKKLKAKGKFSVVR